MTTDRDPWVASPTDVENLAGLLAATNGSPEQMAHTILHSKWFINREFQAWERGFHDGVHSLTTATAKALRKDQP